MLRWIAVPECFQCEIAMLQMEGYYECPQCGFSIDDEEFDEEE